MDIYHHPDGNLHRTPKGHPECPDRIPAIREHLRKSGIYGRLNWIEPQEVELSLLALIHHESYIEKVESKCREAGDQNSQPLDGGDTWVVGDSFRAARLSAGAGIAAVDRVIGSGTSARCFISMRPPGHHALPGKAMGFCLFGNVALAAQYARTRYGVERVLIVDWDVHHGNGTQEIFYKDPNVLFFSIHESPLWPFSGAANETGAGKGEGYTMNFPVPRGSELSIYEKAFRKVLIPRADAFHPDLILVSAGFDAHRQDPLGGICLNSGDFGILTRVLMDLSAKHCDGRILSFLEGGYHLEALARSVESHLRAMEG